MSATQFMSLVLPVVAALVGVWMGQRLEARREARAWKRQPLFDIYVKRFIQASGEVDRREQKLLQLAVRGAPRRHPG